MKLDGRFINNEDVIQDYNYHMIRPTRIDFDTPTISDTNTLTTDTTTLNIADTSTTNTDTDTITIDNPDTITTTVDTSFLVDVGDFILNGKSITIDVKVDLSEWFTDPNQWDLNELNTMLLGNFEAQLDMEQNGDSVFSINDDEE